MRIGVVSDTHNNLKNIEKIIDLFNFEKVSYVIHTGDISNANSLDRFQRLSSNLIGVYGNNDRGEVGIEEVASKNCFDFAEPPSTITIHGRNLAIFHEPDPINEFLSENSNIDVVLHGHTHRYRNEVKNRTLIFNPGESAGLLKGNNAIGIVDLQCLKARRIFF